MPTQSRGQGRGRLGSIRGRLGLGGAPASGGNKNHALAAAIGLAAPHDQCPDARHSSQRRGIVRERSASPQTRWTRRRQTNGDASPSERRPRVASRGGQLYVGRTRLNSKILEHPLMALRPVMPLRTIVDQILMERWRERQPIVRENRDCNCCVVPYRRGEGYYGEPTKAFPTRRPLRIHYDRGLSNAERYAAFIWHAYDENEVVAGEGYAVSSDSFDPKVSSSSSVERYREQREIDDYGSSMPRMPTHYMSGKDTSSNSGNGFENLARD
jgi:hypothetical protein